MAKKSKFEQVWEEKGGWSDWFYPEMKKYEMACCDCGLVHTMELAVVDAVPTGANGEFFPEPVKKRRLQVAMRVKRNNRATANVRRAKRDSYAKPTK